MFITWIDDEGQAISREVPTVHLEVWNAWGYGTVHLGTDGRPAGAYRVPAGGTLILDVEQPVPVVVNKLPPINWTLLGHEALSRGEHKQLSDREIAEVNQMIATAYGKNDYVPLTRQRAVERLAHIFVEARQRYDEHVKGTGNAGAAEESDV